MKDVPNHILHITEDARLELEVATTKFPPFHTAHEGYAILLEEVDELWDLVKVNQKRRDISAMRKEAIQIAAMAMRFALDCCTEGGEGYGK